MAQAMTKITEKELALLINKLQMPLIVRDYMDAGVEPEDSTQFALHELMSNMEPSMALLCAALTLQEIALSHEGLTYLNEVCSKITLKYGSDALVGAADMNLGLLAHDLEQILELMEMCRMSFEIVNPETMVFLNIMIPQIESQVMIVEEIFRLRSIETPITKSSENVIEFPVSA